MVICIYLGWAEAYPPHTEQAQEVAKALLRDIILRHALPLSIGSDNGPAFVSEIIQTVSRTLGIKQKLHTAYRPESSGKAECMNQTLKTTLAKLCQETQLSWIDILLQPYSEPDAPRGAQAIPPLRSYMGECPQ